MHLARFLATAMLAAALGGCWMLPRADEPAAGEPVAARWHSSWYGATVIGREGEKWVVRYSDESLGTVAKADVRRVLRREELRVGQRVIALWRTTQWYPGTVAALDERGATIKWDDGSAPSHAAFGKIAAE